MIYPYSTFPFKTVSGKYDFVFSVLPSITITKTQIVLHWLFWGIEINWY